MNCYLYYLKQIERRVASGKRRTPVRVSLPQGSIGSRQLAVFSRGLGTVEKQQVTQLQE